MMSLKPIFIWKYITYRRNEIPKHIKRLFYLSWEDALWDILDKKGVKKGSTILVPEFFCGDVEENMRNHGYVVSYYPVSNQLKTTSKELSEIIGKHNPAVLVILHPVGMRNMLFDSRAWLSCVHDDTILIEDSVHRIVDPGRITFLKKNHFIIDSLRKVVPLQGSVVYGLRDDMYFSTPSFFQSFLYAMRVTYLWMAMNMFWSLAHLFSKTSMSVQFATRANTLMKTGYDLIGDSVLPARGFFLFNFLQQFIDIEKVRRMKKKQVSFYEKNLISLPKQTFQVLPYTEDDTAEMMAYPIVLPTIHADTALKHIRRLGIILSFELNDSVWSKKQKLIYLPLGPHITIANQRDVVDALHKSC